MATSYRKQAVLAGVQTEFGGNGYTHDSVVVTVTATMGNGSLLDGATEAAVADAATVDGVIDDPKFDEGFYKVGDEVLTRVAKNSVILNGKVIKFSDAAFDGESLTALEAKGVKVQDAETDYSLTQA